MKRNRRSVLEGLVREAVQLGADVLEVEYRNGYEEFVAYRGTLGRELARLPVRTAAAAALRRELHACRARPHRFSLGGEELVLRAEVWESFGEDAFRLDLRRAKGDQRSAGDAERATDS